ncbi:hypothetical protein GJAV_G00118470 [Gymnothorax javanicus]|nr:hypothetical protein GJAV_G00118470 [Gymnothorax javanicus]
MSVEEHKGCSHYVAARANRIQSKDGSLSDTLFTFVTDDLKKQIVLHPVSVNASSWCQTCLERWRLYQWSPNGSHPDTRVRTWAPELSDRRRWLQFDLGEKKKITGIVTTGSTVVDFDYYVRSYKLEFKERNRWKTFTRSNSSEFMVFEGNVDSLHPVRNTLHPPIVTRFLRVLPDSWHQRIALRVELLGYPYIREASGVCTEPLSLNLEGLNTAAFAKSVIEIISVETVWPRSSLPREDEQITEPVTSQADIVQLSIIVVSAVMGVLLVLVGIYLFKTLYKKKTKETPYGGTDAQEMGCWKQIQPFSRHQSTEFTISYSPEKDPVQKLDLVTSSMAEYQQPLMIGTGTVARKGSTFRPMDTETKDELPPDSTPHYDYLHTANQYALPLTNQEPEYATPIIERHAFRKEPFLPDPSYSVPGAVPSKTPSFKATDCSGPRKPGGSFYQTPQVKKDRANNSEGVYDSPKASASPAHNVMSGEYQRPQTKPSVMETYSSPRDCVKAGNGTTQDPTV